MLLLKQFFAVDIPGALFFAVVNILIIGVIIWRIYTPVIELSESGIKVNMGIPTRPKEARWDDIDGMVINEQNALGIKQRTVKLLLKTKGSSTNEILLDLRVLGKADDLPERLRKRIPEKTYNDLRNSPALQRTVAAAELKYKGLTLTPSGLSRGKRTMKWDSITNIQYQGMVIAGYGATTIKYRTKNGEEGFIIKPSISEKYLDVIRYIVQNATSAAIDPGILKPLEYKPGDAKADLMAIPFFVVGIILIFVAVPFLNYYSPTVETGNRYPFLVVPFVLVPMGMTLKVLSGRFLGKNEPVSKKLLWSGLMSVGPVLAILTFFAMSPFSYIWFVGDMYNTMGNKEKAEGYYLKALDTFPDSIDIPYELGKLYREREDWERALPYLWQAYEKDPAYWGAKAVVLAPDTLMKMGKYDEALDMCKEILKNHPKKIDIRNAISEKQDEIIREKRLAERSI